MQVWAFTGVAKPGGATLAEYCSVPSYCLGEVPENITMQGASTLGCAGFAAMIGLWQELGLSRVPAAGNSSSPVLVYGAASCLGMFAIQLLRAAGAPRARSTCVPCVSKEAGRSWSRTCTPCLRCIHGVTCLASDALTAQSDQSRRCVMI